MIAYIGPGLGIGAIIILLLVLLIVIFSLGYIVWFYFRNKLKK
jgi:hypothetical protein